MEPKIAVIIVNWNGKQDTLACLESVSNIEYPNFEVIVVDNGSTDGSVAALSKVSQQILLIRNEGNLGFCGAQTIALKAALERGADYFFMLNNDTLVEPAVLRNLRQAIETDPSIAAVNPLIARLDKREEFFFSGTKIDWGNGDVCGQYDGQEVLSGKTTVGTDFANWCAVLIRKKALESIGMLDERFFAYYEDIDWSVRGYKVGLRTVLYPEVLVYHKGSASTGGNYSPMVYYYLYRNRLLLLKKHGSWLRKLQFSLNYQKDFHKAYQRLIQQGKEDAAQAVCDGVWSALQASFGDARQAAPESFVKTIGAHFGIKTWLLTLRQLF